MLLGLDGLNWKAINAFVEHNIMPHLENMLSESAKGTHTSVKPPTTLPAWTSLTTGVNPGKHGIFDFFKRYGEGEEALNISSDVKYPRIHEILSLNGLKSVVIGLPLTFPIPKYPEISYVTDFLDPFRFWPSKVEKWLKGYFPYSTILDESEGPKERLEKLSKTVEGRLEAILNVLQYANHDLSIVILQEPDMIFHSFYDGALSCENSWINTIFRSIDTFLFKASNLYDLITIISDHGFGRFGKKIFINRILADAGLTRLKDPQSSREGIFNFPLRKFTDLLPPSLEKKGVSWLIERDRLRNFVKKYSWEKREIDMNRSQAFMPRGCSWGIYCKENIHPRKVRESFDKFRNVTHFYQPKDIYWGTFDHPLKVVVEPDYRRGFMLGSGKVPPKTILRGTFYGHRPEGIIIFSGGDVTEKAFESQVYDVVPTLLKYLELPLPARTDGAPLDIFEEPQGKINHHDYLSEWRERK